MSLAQRGTPVTELPVLRVVGRRDRRDGAPPAYEVSSRCCSSETTISAWVFITAWEHSGGRFDLWCGGCGRWSSYRLPPRGAW